MKIRGRHFRRGVNKNMVAFKRKGAKAVLVPAGRGTTKLLMVELPKRLEKILLVQNGTPVATPLQVRVMSSRFGKRYTSRSKSPLVGPEKPPAPPKPKAANPNGDCDGDGQINRVDTDDDNDLLTDDVEKGYDLDGCKADTDGDKVEDGYEYQSARDLNDDEHQSPNDYIPYPREASVPERARQDGRRHRPRRRRPDAARGVPALEGHARERRAAHARRARLLGRRAVLGQRAPGRQRQPHPDAHGRRLRQAGRVPGLGRLDAATPRSACRRSPALLRRPGHDDIADYWEPRDYRRHPRHEPRQRRRRPGRRRTTTSTRPAASATPSATRTPTA